MAWLRNKKYLIQQLLTHGDTLSMAIHGLLYGDHAFFDWTTRKFVQGQPAQLTSVVPEVAIPTFEGTIQRFVYVLDTSDFPDGDFAIIYTDGTGKIRNDLWPEYFSIYQGSPEAGSSIFNQAP